MANIGLGVFGFGCAFPESSSPSGSGMAVETHPRTGTPLEGVTDHSTLALKNDAYHNLPSCYDGLSRFGNIEYNVIDSAGRSSTQIKLDWCYDEKWGQLQWYYNDNDELFHRFFEPDK